MFGSFDRCCSGPIVPARQSCPITRRASDRRAGTKPSVLVFLTSPVIALALAFNTLAWTVWIAILMALLLWWRPYLWEGVLVMAIGSGGNRLRPVFDGLSLFSPVMLCWIPRANVFKPERNQIECFRVNSCRDDIS